MFQRFKKRQRDELDVLARKEAANRALYAVDPELATQLGCGAPAVCHHSQAFLRALARLPPIDIIRTPQLGVLQRKAQIELLWQSQQIRS